MLDLKGKIGNPPAWKGRLSLAWNRGPFGANLAVNHVDGLVNDEPDPGIVRRTVDSQTTVDAQVSFTSRPQEGSWLQGYTVRVGATNLFDEAAPFVDGRNGFGIDPQNYLIEGRTLYVRLSKSF